MGQIFSIKLRYKCGNVPQGTCLKVVTTSENDHSAQFLYEALRKAGFADKDFQGCGIGSSTNWEWTPISGDSSKLSNELRKYWKPVESPTEEKKASSKKKKSKSSNSETVEETVEDTQEEYNADTTGNIDYVDWSLWTIVIPAILLCLLYILEAKILFILLPVLALITLKRIKKKRETDENEENKKGSNLAYKIYSAIILIVYLYISFSILGAKTLYVLIPIVVAAVVYRLVK